MRTALLTVQMAVGMFLFFLTKTKPKPPSLDDSNGLQLLVIIVMSLLLLNNTVILITDIFVISYLSPHAPWFVPQQSVLSIGYRPPYA
jgi:hypothetical protein